MKNISSLFAQARLEGQTHEQHASNSQGFPGNCSDKISSEKMNNALKLFFPKHRRQAMPIILSFIFLFANIILKAQDFIERLDPVVTMYANGMRVEKTVEGSGNDSNYYELRCGATTTTPHSGNYVGITEVVKYAKNGSLIWDYFYSVSPSIFSADSTELLGYAIAVDSGPAATGNIAIGGYASFNYHSGAHTDQDFVMVINSSGTVQWTRYWNPNIGYTGVDTISYGVTDLIFNHDTSHTGSITAVSIDWYSAIQALTVTVLNSSGLINEAGLHDGYDYHKNAIRSLIDDSLKPRIVESYTNQSYYVVGTRYYHSSAGDTSNIGFWTMDYGLTTMTLFQYTDRTLGHGKPDTYVTGAVEDEGTYSGGSPTVFLSGMYKQTPSPLGGDSVPNPLLIEVTNLTASTPTFTPLQISFSTNTGEYVYPTDIAIVKIQSEGVYQLMMPVISYQSSTLKPMVWTVPMNFSDTPTARYNYLTSAPSTYLPMVFGGICSTRDPHVYMLGGQYTSGDVIFCRTDDILSLCNQGSTALTSTYPHTITSPWTGGSAGYSSHTITVNQNIPVEQDIVNVCSGFSAYNSAEPVQPKRLYSESTDNIFYTDPAILEHKGQISLNIYPNPTLGQAYVDIMTGSSSNVRLSVYDLAGKEILGQDAGIAEGTNHLTLDLSSLCPGLYMVKVISADKSINTSTRIEKY